MSEDRIVCHCKNVIYIDIRKAMINGARTLDEITEMTSAGAACGRCKALIQNGIDLGK